MTPSIRSFLSSDQLALVAAAEGAAAGLIGVGIHPKLEIAGAVKNLKRDAELLLGGVGCESLN